MVVGGCRWFWVVLGRPLFYYLRLIDQGEVSLWG